MNSFNLSRPVALILFGLGLALASPPLRAETGFADGDFGGSFGSDATAPAPGPAPGNAGGDFGGGFDQGSFDPGTTAPGVQPPAAPKPPPAPKPGVTPQPPPGGGDFDGGSFEEGSATPPVTGGGAAPAPQPAPAPAPAPPSPAAPLPAVSPEISAFEQRDFGVPPTGQLRNGSFHAPTPTAIPGAQVVGTDSVAQAMNDGTRIVLIDVLGGQYSLPGALMAPGLAEGGTLQDRVQQQAVQWLSQITGGDREAAVVIYCSDPHCWLSYNATLRVVGAGYTNVYWYRGGLQAWQMAGLRLAPSGF